MVGKMLNAIKPWSPFEVLVFLKKKLKPRKLNGSEATTRDCPYDIIRATTRDLPDEDFRQSE